MGFAIRQKMVIFVGVFRKVLGKTLLISFGLVGGGRFDAVFSGMVRFFGSSSLRSVAAYRFWQWIGSVPVIYAPRGCLVVAGVLAPGGGVGLFLARMFSGGLPPWGRSVGWVSSSFAL